MVLVPVSAAMAVRSASSGCAPMSVSTVAAATPWIVVAVTHLAYCPTVGVPELLTLPPPAAVLALAWPGVVKSQVIDAVLVSTRSLVSVASADAVMYSAPTGAPPPPPGGAAQEPSARRKLVVPPPESGAR